MRIYKISYIDGHDMKFKTFTVMATDERNAVAKLWKSYEKQGDFDHVITSIKEYII